MAKLDGKALKEAANERDIAAKLVQTEMIIAAKLGSKEAQLKKRADVALARSEQTNIVYAQ